MVSTPAFSSVLEALNPAFVAAYFEERLSTTLPVFRFSVNKNLAARDSKLKESTQ
jgi:hypothetical protein